MWMIKPDRRFSYREAFAAIEDVAVIEAAIIESWTNKHFRDAVMARNDDWLDEVPDNLRKEAGMIVGLYGQVVSRYFQVGVIIADAWKVYAMANKYPWHGTEISKSDHLYFVWLSFTHHCYLFKERVKKFYEDWNKLRALFQMKKADGGRHIKQIDSRLGEYIQFRGIHTHEYNVSHDSTEHYQLVAQLTKLDAEKYKEQERDFYFEAKHAVRHHILSGVGMMVKEFVALNGNPQEDLKSIAQAIMKTEVFSKSGEAEYVIRKADE